MPLPVAAGIAYVAHRVFKTCAPPPIKDNGRIPPELLQPAQVIEQYFSIKGLPFRPVSGQRGFQVSSLRCAVLRELGQRVYMAQEKDLAWQLDSKSMKNLTMEATGGCIVIRWTHPPIEHLLLSDLFLQHPSTSHQYIVGVTMENEPVRVPLDYENPHVIVAGTTGSGKTIALIVLLINALKTGSKVIICNHKNEPRDRKRLRLREWESAGNVVYAGTIGDVETVLNRVASSLRTQGRTLLIVDEAATLLASRPRVADTLGQIVQMGRDFDLHVALASPELTKNVLLDSMITSNIATSIIGLRVPTSRQSYHAIGISNLHLNDLAGKGDAKVIVGGTVIRAQIAFPDNWRHFVGRSQPKPELAVMDAITEEWLESIRVGGHCSISALQRYAAARGQGKEFYHWQQQYRLLETAGWLETKGSYKGGVRVK